MGSNSTVKNFTSFLKVEELTFHRNNLLLQEPFLVECRHRETQTKRQKIYFTGNRQYVCHNYLFLCQKYSSAKFKKILNPTYIISRIQRLEGK